MKEIYPSDSEVDYETLIADAVNYYPKQKAKVIQMNKSPEILSEERELSDKEKMEEYEILAKLYNFKP